MFRNAPVVYQVYYCQNGGINFSNYFSVRRPQGPRVSRNALRGLADHVPLGAHATGKPAPVKLNFPARGSSASRGWKLSKKPERPKRPAVRCQHIGECRDLRTRR